jgi:hypothetical protein
MLVVTGRVDVAADDVAGLVRELRQRVTGARGAIMTEEMTAATGEPPRATLRLRLPPPEVQPLLDWLGARAQILSRDLKAADVSREFVDRQMAIKSLRVTATRLQKLIEERPGVLADVLAIERELTRVRRELEQHEGAQRLLADQVARATLDLTITPTAIGAAPIAPRAKFQLMASGGLLGFADARGRAGARAGAGVTLLFNRLAALDLQIFPATDREARSFTVSLSSAFYSDFLGGGRRRFLNPYLGLLLVAGSIDGLGMSGPGALVGVELYRGEHLLVDLQTRAQGFFYSGDKRPDDLALQGVLGAGVPF